MREFVRINPGMLSVIILGMVLLSSVIVFHEKINLYLDEDPLTSAAASLADSPEAE